MSIGAALGVAVEHHDDGSVDGLYDLRVGPVDEPLAAIEVVGAVSQVFIETWNTMPACGPFGTGGVASWTMVLDDGAVSKRVVRRAPAILRALETDGWHRRAQGNLLDLEALGAARAVLSSLGCVALYVGRDGGTGRLDLTMGGDGGTVDHQGESLPHWIGDFLRSEKRADVLRKLAVAHAQERHVFVPVTFKGAPFAVTSYLTSDTHPLPLRAPRLPDPVDQVWIASTFGSTTGVRWNGVSWARFDLVRRVESDSVPT